MESTTVVFNDQAYGEVQLFTDEIKAGKMDIAVTKERLTVFHTEIGPEFEGRGFAKLLLEKLVSYAREKNLKIVPLCPYVNIQFRRHPAQYADVWEKEFRQ